MQKESTNNFRFRTAGQNYRQQRPKTAILRYSTPPKLAGFGLAVKLALIQCHPVHGFLKFSFRLKTVPEKSSSFLTK